MDFFNQMILPVHDWHSINITCSGFEKCISELSTLRRGAQPKVRLWSPQSLHVRKPDRLTKPVFGVSSDFVNCNV